MHLIKARIILMGLAKQQHRKLRQMESSIIQNGREIKLRTTKEEFNKSKETFQSI